MSDEEGGRGKKKGVRFRKKKRNKAKGVRRKRR